MSHSGEEEDQRERERERQNERLTNSRLANAGIVAFPNLLAPAVRPEPAALYMEPDDPERQYRIASLARQRSALYQDSPYGVSNNVRQVSGLASLTCALVSVLVLRTSWTANSCCRGRPGSRRFCMTSKPHQTATAFRM